MKKLIAIVACLLPSVFGQTVPVTGTLVPAGPSFPLIDTWNVRGGGKVVTNVAGLTNIPAVVRQPGMRAYVISEDAEYVLESDLTTWRLSDYLLSSEQTLTTAQKVIARNNQETAAYDDVSGVPWLTSKGISVSATSLTPAAGTGFGMSAPVDSHVRVGFINLGNQARLVQSGTITALRFYMPNTAPADCQIKIMIWRRDADRWDLHAVTEDLRPSMTTDNAVHTITLANPIYDCEIGDYVGGEITYVSGSWGAALHVRNTPSTYSEWTAQQMRYGYSLTLEDGAAIDSVPILGNVTLPIDCMMESPVVCVIGDSRVAGYPGGRALFTPTQDWNKDGDIAYRLEKMFGVPCRQVGIEGNKTTMMDTRFTNDVLNCYPRLVGIYTGGWNDSLIPPYTDFTNSVQAVTNMINAALANDCKVFVCSDWPSEYRNTDLNRNTLSIQLDDRAALIENTIKATYSPSNVWWIDLRRDMGVERPDNGLVNWKAYNRWNLNTLFNVADSSDGVHMTPAGRFQTARTTAEGVRTWLRTLNENLTPSVFTSVTLGGNTFTNLVGSGLRITGSTLAAHTNLVSWAALNPLTGVSATIDVLISDGTTNRLVFNSGILISNITSF